MAEENGTSGLTLEDSQTFKPKTSLRERRVKTASSVAAKISCHSD
jgi:hypothetical protein